MYVTASELKTNLAKYLAYAAEEDVVITRYGKPAAKLTAPFRDRTETAESLFGILPRTMSLEEAKEERFPIP